MWRRRNDDDEELALAEPGENGAPLTATAADAAVCLGATHCFREQHARQLSGELRSHRGM